MSHVDFNGKTFIVAGAGGIGAATAIALNNYGAKIIVLDIDESKIEELMLNLKGENTSYLCDFSNINSIESLIKAIVEKHGAIDGLAFCVGVGFVRPIKMSKYDFMKRVMDINFFSFVEMIRCLSLKGNYGNEGMVIVGISAIGAFLGNSTKTAYCASKSAMNSAVRCLAKELAQKGFRINTVAPGVTDTPMARAAEDYGSGSANYNAIIDRQYLGICQPEDIADTVVYLMSDLSKKITGSCIPVDGGKLSS